MLGILTTLLWFALALGLLVAVHEYGHFAMARLFGVRVLRFSIGFGKAWWRWTDRRGTEYILAMIPLGGYVKLLDAREAEVPPEQQGEEFSTRPVGQRLLVYLAGPLINLLFAVLLYWGLFVAGSQTLVPIVGKVLADSPAAAAGVPVQQEIIAVDDQPSSSWEAVSFALADRIGDTGEIRLTLRDRQAGAETSWALPVQAFMAHAKPELDPMQQLGIEPYRPAQPAVIDALVANGPAEQAGLRVNDEVVSVNDHPIADWSEWVAVIRSHPQQALAVKVRRGSQELMLEVIPAAIKNPQNGVAQGQIGAQGKQVLPPADVLRHHSAGIVEGFLQALAKTADIVLLTLTTLGKMLTGSVGLDNLNGPIAIAQTAGNSAQYGVIAFVNFLAYLSIGLGVFNLLPVPVLDGGHVLFGLIEALRGKALSERVQQMGLNVGVGMLSLLMLVAFYNDVMRLLH